MDELPAPLPDGAVETILNHLDGEARQEFIEGVDKRVHLLSMDPSSENARKLVMWVQEWAISLVVQSTDRWRADRADTDRRVASGDLGDPADRRTLRHVLLGR